MTTTRYSRARRAVKLFPRTEYTDRKAVNALRRKHIAAVEEMGAKWVCSPERVLRKINSDGGVLVASLAGGVQLLVHDVVQKVMA